MKVIVQTRQTLSDIAIQVYGDIRGITALVEANNINITDTLTPGTEIECPEIVYDSYLQNYVISAGIEPATAIDVNGEIRGNTFTEQFTKEFS